MPTKEPAVFASRAPVPSAREPRSVIADGASLFVDDLGEGEPLLLLHGFGGTGKDWRQVFDLGDLAARFRLIIPDARGHGRSSNPKDEFTFRRCAEDALAIMDHLGIERAGAVGLSLGAKTLLHLATLAPARVSRMILVSATPRFPEATREMMRAMAAAEHAPVEWEMMRAQHVLGDAQIEALWRIPARMDGDTSDMSFTAERLAAITAKTLLVAGDRDPLYPVELAVELYRGIPNASLYVVPGGGHGPVFMGERKPFVKRALEFLA